MTHNLALRGPRHAAHHVRLLRPRAQCPGYAVSHPRCDKSILKQIRNASSASATAESPQPSQPPRWGSLIRKSESNPQRVAEGSSQADLLTKPDPPQTLFHQKEDVNISPNQETVEDVEDTSKALTQEDASSHEALTSFEDVNHQRSESVAIPSFQVRPQLLDNVFKTPQTVPYLAPGTSEQEIIPALYALLRKQAALGKMQEVEEIVQQLVSRCGEAPNTRLYAAMILVNHNAEFGSAAEVGRILEEMRNERMEPDEACYHNALKVRVQ